VLDALDDPLLLLEEVRIGGAGEPEANERALPSLAI
jgi:hypothetical protein